MRPGLVSPHVSSREVEGGREGGRRDGVSAASGATSQRIY